MSTPSTSRKIAPVIASTRKKSERIDSAGGEAGSKIDRLLSRRRSACQQKKSTHVAYFLVINRAAA